jgi:hypothetical protein
MTNEVDEMSAASRGSHGPDIVERLRACETRPLTTMSEECRAVTRDPAAWVELWKTLNDARVEIERLRLALADSIRRPMGVIPESADGLVTQDDLDAAENRRQRWQQAVCPRETRGDLVQRLRDRACSGLPDPLSEQAAQEIERLRLTAVEREALEFVVAEGRVACGHETDILRGVLKRLA